ncbi:MAG: ribosomal small subunit pseudouridine synthase [Clostridiales bacterium]|jgi:16S rRNA pseudouridine516 synthase|nr:ribosomal small subunit pseudouridine synthase [Clostridiales bacterium]
MKTEYRLDKYLADMGIGTRTEVKVYVRKGFVKVNGAVVKAPDTHINTQKDTVEYKDEVVQYVNYEYYMLNKPAGVVSATEDKWNETVVDLVDSKRKDLFPVGRLDKDTEGLLILTNDGILAHELLSPKKHISKVYYAKIDGCVTENDVVEFKNGVVLLDGYSTLPADLKILSSGKCSEIELTIYEGKFHQVKRMFEALDKTVVYLKRLSMGPVSLDDNLSTGDYRPLTNEELQALRR